MQDVGVEADYSQYLHYEEYMQTVVARTSPIDYGLINKGQALIWSANLLHGGSPAKDPSRTRKSQVTHFFFEGSRYYTPLMSKTQHRRRHLLARARVDPLTPRVARHEEPHKKRAA